MRRAFLGLVLLGLVLPGSVAAQRTRLRLSGFNGRFGRTELTDLDQGYREATSPTTITVSLLNMPTVERVASVYIRASGTGLGGGKPVGDILWRRDDLATWNPLTTSDALVESQNLLGSGAEWTNGVWFRCLLSWTDPPMTYATTATLTLVVSTP